MDFLCKSDSIEQFIPLHEGLPNKFIEIVNYVVNVYQKRTYINIYNIARQTSLYTSDIREYISPFINKGIEISGDSNNKLLFNRKLIDFWLNILLPSYQVKQNELKQYINIIDKWTIESIKNDPVFKKYLPQNYGTLSKTRLTYHLINNIFHSKSIYKEYCLYRLKFIDISDKEFYNNIDNSFYYSEIDNSDKKIWKNICNLYSNLLIKMTYKTNEGYTHLYLSKFNSFYHPHKLNLSKGPEPLSIPKCINISINETEILLHKKTEILPETNFLLRQINIVKERERNAYDLFDFILSWERIIGLNCMSIENTRELGSCLCIDKNNNIRPFIISNCDIEKLLNLSVKYNFLSYNIKSKRYQITQFGIATAKKSFKSIPGVKRVWARNKERLTIFLNQDWHNVGNKILKIVAKEINNGVYIIEKDDLISKKITEKKLLTILSGFFEIKPLNIHRIRSWLNISDLPQLRSATVIPKNHCIVNTLLENTILFPWNFEITSNYLVIVGVTPAKFEKWFFNHLKEQR